MEIVYELHDDGELVATGRLTVDAIPERGDVLPLGDRNAVVTDVLPSTAGVPRVILRLP